MSVLDKFKQLPFLGVFIELWESFTNSTPSLPSIPDAVRPVEKVDPHQALIAHALKRLGVHCSSTDHGPEVDEWETAILGTTGLAWCMTFAQVMIKEVEKELGITSPIVISGGCLDVWSRDVQLQRKDPAPGRLMIWHHPGTVHGHVGIVMRINPNGSIHCVEGNSIPDSASSDAPREVCEKNRPASGYPNFQLLGYIDPFVDAL